MLLSTQYLENWLKKQNFPKNTINRGHAVTEYDYEIPLLPLKEGLVNAVVHRDYAKDGGYVYFSIQNRGVVIDSPGQPEPITTLAELNAFQAVPYSRNGLMSTIFARAHLMEKTQYGMKTFSKMREMYGIPQPQYEQKGMYVRLFFPKNDDCASNIIAKKDLTVKLSKSLLLCYEFVRLHGEISRIEYQEYAGLIPKTAARHLLQLIEMGLVETNGEPTTSPKIKYRVKK